MSSTLGSRPACEGLVAAAVAGDRRATAELLGTLEPRIVRYCRARLGRSQCSYASADDVAQDVLLAVLGALPRYRGADEAFAAYALGIARHKIADFRRDSYRDRSVPVDELPEPANTSAGPDHLVLHAEVGAQLAALLAALTELQREIVTLRVIVGLTAEETARAISSTPGAVRVAQHRALASMRRLLLGA